MPLCENLGLWSWQRSQCSITRIISVLEKRYWFPGTKARTDLGCQTLETHTVTIEVGRCLTGKTEPLPQNCIAICHQQMISVLVFSRNATPHKQHLPKAYLDNTKDVAATSAISRTCPTSATEHISLLSVFKVKSAPENISVLGYEVNYFNTNTSHVHFSFTSDTMC